MHILTDHQDEYIYETPRAGIYRFDYSIDDVNDNYKVVIKDEKNAIINENFCSDEGCTVELKGKKKYYVYVKQATGSAKYKIKIHTPKKTRITFRFPDGQTIDYEPDDVIFLDAMVHTALHRHKCL